MDRLRRANSPLPAARAPVRAPGGGVARHRRRPSIAKAAESFQSMLVAGIRSVTKRGSVEDMSRNGSPFFAAFLRLPRELQIQIFGELCVADLLALRRTCRSLNNLITDSGPSLVRYWVKHKLGTMHTRLYPPPRPNKASLQYLLAMRRRHIASVRLTRQLADFVLKDTQRYTGEKERPRQRQMWASVYEKMLPLVFGVGYYLEEHRRAILERDLGRIRPRSIIGYDICTTPGITLKERKILARLDPPLRLQFFYMYSFILQVLVRKLRPPICGGSVEKVLRGWRKPACAEDVAFVLILGGVGQVAKLLACRNYSERRRLLHAFTTRLSPHESTRWRDHWRSVGVTSPALLDDIPCSSIGITQLDEIWVPLITEGMRPESREFTVLEKERYEEVRASRNFLNELMGYDFLRGRLADADYDDEPCEEENGYV